MATLGNTPRPAYVYDTETDTWVPIGVGAHTHDYIPNTLVDAKGDILTATADNVPARLAKGADGTVLVSDSTTSTGLAWQPYAAQYVAGKNLIINGGMDIAQRGTSGNLSNGWSYLSVDRFQTNGRGSNGTISQVALTPNEIPGTGLKYALKYDITSNPSTQPSIETDLEQPQLVYGRTYTYSFYAKASKAITVNTYVGAQCATVGYTDPTQSHLVTTSWQRFTRTFTFASPTTTPVAGDVIYYNFATPLGDTYTLYISGVQLEAGPVATPFSRAGGTLQGELAACQRYYFRVNAFATSSYAIFGAGAGNSTTQARTIVPFPVTMRVKPTSIDYPTVGSNFAIIGYDDSINVAPTAAALDTNQSDTQSGYILWTASSGVVASRPLVVRGQATTNAYLGFNAEL